MAGPIDAVVAIHNAFEPDMAIIDAAALDTGTRASRARGGRGTVLGFSEVLEWHAHGEEAPGLCGARGRSAPSVAEAYEKDQVAVSMLLSKGSATRCQWAMLWKRARATAAFKFSPGDLHLAGKTATSTASSRARSVPDQAKRMVSWRVSFPRTASPSSWHGCIRSRSMTTARTSTRIGST